MDIGCPLNRGVRQAQRGEDLFVEVVATDKALVHHFEELARAGALNHAVIVGARHGEGLRDPQICQHLGCGALELCRILQSTHTNDAPLPLHQARNRMHGADAAGVRQRNCGALEVCGGQFALTRALHEVLVRGEVLIEVEGVGPLDRGNHECARAIRLGEVDRDTQADVRGGDDRGLAVDFGVGDVLAWELFQCLDDRPADQMRERHFATAATTQMVIDDDAIVDHQLRGHGAHTGRRRDRQTLVHVLRNRARDTLQGRDSVFFCRVLLLANPGFRRISGDRRAARGRVGGARGELRRAAVLLALRGAALFNRVPL